MKTLEQEWDDVYKLCEAQTKKTLVELLMDLAATSPQCNSCDDPQEVKRVIKEQIEQLLEIGAIT